MKKEKRRIRIMIAKDWEAWNLFGVGYLVSYLIPYPVVVLVISAY